MRLASGRLTLLANRGARAGRAAAGVAVEDQYAAHVIATLWIIVDGLCHGRRVAETDRPGSSLAAGLGNDGLIPRGAVV